MFTQLQNTLALWLANLGSDERALEGEDGQTLAEYAMILGLIAVVVVGVVTLLGGTISSIFSSIQVGI
jgi:pilus assembly protein Flp/PilA